MVYFSVNIVIYKSGNKLKSHNWIHVFFFDDAVDKKKSSKGDGFGKIVPREKIGSWRGC